MNRVKDAPATGQREAAAAEVARLRGHERTLLEGGALRDGEGEVLHLLTQLRAATIGEVRRAEGLDALRAALQRVFSAFTLHRIWPESTGYATEVGMNLDDEWWLEPEVRPEMYAGKDLVPLVEEPSVKVGWPLARRVSLDLPANKEANCLKFDSA